MRHRHVVQVAVSLCFVPLAASLVSSPPTSTRGTLLGPYQRPATVLSERIGFDDVDASPSDGQTTGGGRPRSLLQGAVSFDTVDPTEPQVVNVEGKLPGQIWRRTKPIRDSTLKPVSVTFKALGVLKDTAYTVAELPDIVKEELEAIETEKQRKEQLKLAQQREAEREAAEREQARERTKLQLAETVDSIVNFPKTVQTTVETTIETTVQTVNSTVLSVQTTVQNIQTLPEQLQKQLESTKATLEDTKTSLALTADDVVYGPVRFVDGIRCNVVRTGNVAVQTKYLIDGALGKTPAEPEYFPLPEAWAPPSKREQLRLAAQKAREAEIARQPRTIALKVAGLGAKAGLMVLTTAVTGPFRLVNGLRKAKTRYDERRERVENALLLEAEKTKEKRDKLEALKAAALETAIREAEKAEREAEAARQQALLEEAEQQEAEAAAVASPDIEVDSAASGKGGASEVKQGTGVTAEKSVGAQGAQEEDGEIHKDAIDAEVSSISKELESWSSTKSTNTGS